MGDTVDIRKFLDPVKVPDTVKANAWDAFYAATSPDDFKRRFDRLPLPEEVKADLWDAKFAKPKGAKASSEIPEGFEIESLPPLPPGFELESAPTPQPLPPLPPGFELESAPVPTPRRVPPLPVGTRPMAHTTQSPWDVVEEKPVRAVPPPPAGTDEWEVLEEKPAVPIPRRPAPKTLPADFAGFDEATKGRAVPPSTLPADFSGFDEVAVAPARSRRLFPSLPPGTTPMAEAYFRRVGMAPTEVPSAPAPTPVGFEEAHPTVAKILDVVTPRLYTYPEQTAEAVRQAALGLGKTVGRALTPSPWLEPRPAEEQAKQAVRQGNIYEGLLKAADTALRDIGTTAGQAATIAFSPFMYVTSPAAPEISKVVGLFDTLFKHLNVGDIEIAPEYKGKPFSELIQTPGAFKSQGPEADVILEEISGFAPFVALGAAGEAVKPRPAYRPLTATEVGGTVERPTAPPVIGAEPRPVVREVSTNVPEMRTPAVSAERSVEPPASPVPKRVATHPAAEAFPRAGKGKVKAEAPPEVKPAEAVKSASGAGFGPIPKAPGIKGKVVGWHKEYGVPIIAREGPLPEGYYLEPTKGEVAPASGIAEAQPGRGGEPRPPEAPTAAVPPRPTQAVKTGPPALPTRPEPPTAVAKETLPRDWAESVAEAVENRPEARGLFPDYSTLVDKALAAVRESPDFSENDIVPTVKRLIEEARPLRPGARTAGGGGPTGAYGYAPKVAPRLPTVEQIGATPERTSRAAVIKLLAEKLQRPFSTGWFRAKALGIYKVLPEGIRTKKANDIMVALHEAGHHVNKVLWGTYNKPSGRIDLNWKPLQPFRKSELNPENGFGYRPSGRSYLPEAFADFVQEYVSKPAEAQKRAPKFFEFFEKAVASEPELQAMFQDVRGKIRDYVSQSPKQKILAHIVQGPPVESGFTLNKFYTWVFDRLQPVQQVVEAMRAAGGKEPTTDAYVAGRLLAGWWGKADHFLNRGTFDAKTLEVTGKSLKETLRGWDGRLDDLRTYLVAERALELQKRGKATGIDPGDAKTAVAELEAQHPDIKATAQEIYRYNDSTLRYVRDKGFLSEEQYSQIRAMNEKYVPFYRLIEEAPEPGAGGGGGKKVADLWQPMKRLKGSERQIIDPLESTIRNTYSLISLAERNAVAKALVEQARATEGSARWLEEVPGPQKPTSFELKEIKGTLAKAGVDIGDAELKTVATVFRPSGNIPKSQGILTVFENGKRSFWQVHDKELYRALEAMDEESTNILVKVASVPARMLRFGATAAGPEFVIRNPIRDATDAWMQSRNGFIPGLDSVKGLFHALKQDDLYWEWKRAGGEHAALLSMDSKALREHLKDLTGSKVAWVVRHPIEVMRLLSELGESQTRLGEYAKARKAGKPPQQAALESREVTIDFARMGAKTKAMNAITAFWNAAVQGTDKFLRVHKANPLGAFAKGFVGLTLPTLALWWVNKDDQKYKDLPSWEKDFFWHFPTKGTRLESKTPFIRIPKPFLWGMVYSSTFERIADWIHTKDPTAFDDLIGNVWTAGMPAWVPTAAVPWIEAWANKSLFRGTRLEPQYLERVQPEYRATSYTSEFAKRTAEALAKIGIHYSPIRIDNTIFGYSAGLGRAISEAANAALREGPSKRPARTWADIPFVRAFSVRYPTPNSKPVEKFYDRLEQLRQKAGTGKLAKKYPGRIEEAPQMSSGERRELKRLESASQRMSKAAQSIRKIDSDPKLTPEQKRSRIDTLTKEQTEIARKAMKRGSIHQGPTGGF